MTISIPDTTFFSPAENAVLEKVWAINKELKNAFIQRDEIIDTLFIGLLCKQHTLLIGPPGAAKSLLIEKFTKCIEGYQYFDWLLTKFTTPEELFGPPSIQGLKEGRYERIPDGKLQQAHIVYLDEVFDGNSAILNALKNAMNEGTYEREPIPLEVVYGATNHIPKKNNLAAFFDRFLLRHFVRYIYDDEQNFRDLIMLQNYTPSSRLTKDEVDLLRAKLHTVSVDGILNTLVKLWQFLRAENVYPSDRRWRWGTLALQARAMLDGRKAVNQDDLQILKHILWTEKREIKIIEAMIMKTISPIAAKIQELYADAVQINDDLKILDPEDADDKDKISEGLNKLKEISQEVETLANKPQISSQAKEVAEKLKKKIDKIYLKNIKSKLNLNL